MTHSHEASALPKNQEACPFVDPKPHQAHIHKIKTETKTDNQIKILNITITHEHISIRNVNLLITSQMH